MRRTATIGLLVALSVGGGVCGAFRQASSSPSDAAYFIAATNSLRVQAHLAPLPVDGGLTVVGENWATFMSQVQSLSHRPNVQQSLGGDVVAVGENVGTGGSLPAIEGALEASPEHRANLLDPAYNRIGVGVAQSSDGRYWVAEEFEGVRVTVVPSPLRVATTTTTTVAPVTTTTTAPLVTALPIAAPAAPVVGDPRTAG